MEDEQINSHIDDPISDEEGLDVDRPVMARVRLIDSAESTVQFVNHVTSQFTLEEFIITFAQVVPPSGAEMTLEEFQAITHVDARVVCRVGLSPARMRQMIDVLEENYTKYVDRFVSEEPQ